MKTLIKDTIRLIAERIDYAAEQIIIQKSLK
jgi:hypothetical protein